MRLTSEMLREIIRREIRSVTEAAGKPPARKAAAPAKKPWWKTESPFPRRDSMADLEKVMDPEDKGPDGRWTEFKEALWHKSEYDREIDLFQAIFGDDADKYAKKAGYGDVYWLDFKPR